MESQPNMDDVKITRESLSEYLRKRYQNRPIVFDTCPDMLDGLLAELCIGRFDTIGQLDNTLARTEKAVELFEMDNPPDIGLADSRYSAIGIVKLSIRLLNDYFFTPGDTIFDGDLRDKLQEYRKHILPDKSDA